ncbi:MAG: HAD-IC family P-type ATPase [Clostridia bacterium]|nr:HAD-IC family P-type ATPase [Clostridia bacterium]
MAKNNTKQVKIEDVISQSKKVSAEDQKKPAADEKQDIKPAEKVEVKKEAGSANVDVKKTGTSSLNTDKNKAETEKNKALKSKDKKAKLDDKKVSSDVKKQADKKVEEKKEEIVAKPLVVEEPEIEVATENKSKNISDKKKEKEEKSKDKKPSLWSKIFRRKAQEVEKRPTRVKRVRTDANIGLTDEQVQERINKGQTNVTPNKNVKTYKRIFFENIFTFFNVLCLAVAISLMCVGAWSNCLFMVIIVVNTLIGIIQEIRAKKTIEKLSLLTAPAVKVMRGGAEYTITTDDIVIDDIVVLSNGKQIVADSRIVEGQIEVNESMLTGESLPIKKKAGDVIYAGSFVVSGSCRARVEKVGENNYIQQLAAKAKQYKRPKSELFNSLKTIIRVIGMIIIPIAILMYLNNYRATGSVTKTITQTAGSIIGMIPAGMFLLSSVALTVSVIKLARRQALVQDLYCVEMLARVNVLCLDKTGTITDGTMKVYNCLQLNNTNFTLKRIMGSMLSALGDNNQTSQALINYFGYNKELKPVSTVPFSSSRKLSAVTFENAGTYIMGAPEFVMPNLDDDKIKNMIEQYAKDGYRVLLLAHSTNNIIKDNPPSNRTPIALLILEDRIRDDAISTISWFKNNGVKVKIISGDNPLTVAEIAKRVGVDNTESFINLEGLNEKQVMAAANKYTVFGRVTPEQKAILIKAMKTAGNTVAMTGDGVNDILALKEADCSIAMASGSEAVRSVSHMVLLNSDFGSMPATVLEGRRVINNVQKSSSLFFMKTIFTIIFSIVTLILQTPYPLSTTQLILMETCVIGIPSFFLAFLPNDNQVQGKFIYNLIRNALPGAITLLLNIGAVYMFVYLTNGTIAGAEMQTLLSTMCAITLTFTGLGLLMRLCKPWTVLTTLLFIIMASLCFLGIVINPANFFQLGTVDLTQKLFIVILTILSPTLINVIYSIFERIKI